MLGLGTLMRPSHPRLLASRKSQMPRVRRSCCRAGGNASGIAPPMPEQHCRESSHQHSDGEGHHGHSHFPESPVSRLLDRLGLISLSTELTHSGRWTMASITCFAIALMAGASEPTARLMGGSAAAAAATRRPLPRPAPAAAGPRRTARRARAARAARRRRRAASSSRATTRSSRPRAPQGRA